MKRSTTIATLASVVLLSGCAGQLYIHTNDKTAGVMVDGECTKYKGVPFFALKKSTQHYLYDRVLDSNGKIIRHYGWEQSKRCEPIVRSETSLVPDPEKLYVAEYDAKPFETVTFNVSLTDKGTLSSIGTVSTPGEKTALDSVIAVATTARAFSHGFNAQKSGVAAGTPPISNPEIPLCDSGKIPVDADFIGQLEKFFEVQKVKDSN